MTDRNISPGMAEWSKRITQAHVEGILAIIESGQVLIEAKADCTPAEWQIILKKLRIDEAVAERLMAIARYRPLLAHATQLPHSREILYLLSLLPEERFGELIEDGTINPEMSPEDAGRELGRAFQG